MKLLVMDDQGPVGAIISRIAQQGGWESIHTTNTRGLADIIRKEDVQVLMIDYIVSGANDPRTGLVILQELRDAGITIPAILFSGAAHLIDQKLADQLGVVRVLEKPLSIQELRASLNEAKKALLNGSPPTD